MYMRQNVSAQKILLMFIYILVSDLKTITEKNKKFLEGCHEKLLAGEASLAHKRCSGIS
jgi:hypothetical protein